MTHRSKRKSLAKRNDKGKESKRDTSSRNIPKRPCRKNQTLLVSRSGSDDVSDTVRLASPEEEEVDFGSIASADEEEEEWDDKYITSEERERSLMTDL